VDLDWPVSAFLDGPFGLDMVMDPTAVIPTKAVSYSGTGDATTVADSPWQQLGDGAIQTTPSQLVRWASQYWSPTIGGPALAAARLDRAAAAEGGGVYGAGIFATDIVERDEADRCACHVDHEARMDLRTLEPVRAAARGPRRWVGRPNVWPLLEDDTIRARTIDP